MRHIDRFVVSFVLTMDSDQKVCPLCAETIKAGAKVCPFCHSPQGSNVRWRAYLGPIISGVMLMAVIAFGFGWLFPHIFRSEGRNFTPHRDELIVDRTSLERDQVKPEFGLSGYITNSGNYPWRVQELELRFMQGKSNLVDVRHADLSDSFVVQPHQEQAFRVSLGKLIFTNSDIVMRVRVQSATDGNRPPKTD